MVKSKVLNFNYLEKIYYAKYLEYNYHISNKNQLNRNWQSWGH